MCQRERRKLFSSTSIDKLAIEEAILIANLEINYRNIGEGFLPWLKKQRK